MWLGAGQVPAKGLATGFGLFFNRPVKGQSGSP